MLGPGYPTVAITIARNAKSMSRGLAGLKSEPLRALRGFWWAKV